MRITVSHEKGQQEAIRRIDQAAEDLVRSAAVGPIRLANFQKRWQSNVLHFAVTGSMGMISHDVSGTLEVTEKEVICEFNLPGFLARLLGEGKVEQTVQTTVRGLLA
jgi:hypothetical protein